MKDIRRKEKAISNINEIKDIIARTRFITVAMCADDNPYLVTITHGYDLNNDVIYFHCAQEGKKIDVLNRNNRVWGEALIDYGYQKDKCDHLYASAHFKGTVSFIDDVDEKRKALEILIKHQEKNPSKVYNQQVNEESIRKVHIGKIKVEYLSGKKSI